MPGPFDPGALGSMMAGLQQNLERMQAEADAATFEGSAGGGAVRVTASANEVRRVTIRPSAMDDREMLEDLIVVATNDALGKAKAHAAQSAMDLMSGMGMPPGLLDGLLPK